MALGESFQHRIVVYSFRNAFSCFNSDTNYPLLAKTQNTVLRFCLFFLTDFTVEKSAEIEETMLRLWKKTKICFLILLAFMQNLKNWPKFDLNREIIRSRPEPLIGRTNLTQIFRIAKLEELQL